jgi:hypothetical protein
MMPRPRSSELLPSSSIRTKLAYFTSGSFILDLLHTNTILPLTPHHTNANTIHHVAKQQQQQQQQQRQQQQQQRQQVDLPVDRPSPPRPSDRHDRRGLPPVHVGVRPLPGHGLGVRGNSPTEAVRTHTIPSILNEHLTDYWDPGVPLLPLRRRWRRRRRRSRSSTPRWRRTWRARAPGAGKFMPSTPFLTLDLD